MPPKKFEIFKTEAEIKEGEKDYRNRILRIANGGIIEARIAEISKTLHNELHSKKNIDTKGEMEKYRNAREDVCLSFCVPEDGDHVSIEPERSGMQRSYRAFAVFVDRAKENKETGLHEAFYSEGRTAHHQLLERIMELMKNYGIEDVDMEAYSNDSEKIPPDFIMEDLEKDPNSKNGPRWLFFKGFLLENEEELNNMPDSIREKIMSDFLASRKNMEEKMEDSKGIIDNGSMNWFLTGSNVPSSHHDKS